MYQNCEHLQTAEIFALPGIVMCEQCGALFDCFDPYNSPALTTPLTPGQLDIIITAISHNLKNAA